VALQVARDRGIPGVYEIRCINGDYDLDALHPYLCLRGWQYNALEYALCREASTVVTISHGLAERLAGFGVPRDRIYVVRNSVDTDLFAPPPQRGPMLPDVLRVGYATTFERIENLDQVIRAVPTAVEGLAALGKRLEVVLAGIGHDWERIASLVSDLQLEGIVKLPGFLPYGQMPAFYAEIDLFLVPRKASRVTRDTTPLKPLEAAASGLPLLASNIPALRELLGRHEGVRFVEPTSASIARALVDFARIPWSRSEIKGPQEEGADNRSWMREVQEYKAVYRTAQANGPPLPRRERASTRPAPTPEWASLARLQGMTHWVKMLAIERGWLRAVGYRPLEKHVVVCGFPRAGSTLLQLMVQACISDTDTFRGEIGALWAARHATRTRPYMLTKLPCDVEQIVTIRAEYARRTAQPLFVLTVRDPRAILTSCHKAYPDSWGYYVSVQRWRRVWELIRCYCHDPDVLLIRYEDLVCRPAHVQQMLEQFVGWTARHPFGRYHEVAQQIRRDSMTEGALGGLRPLDPSSLDKWRETKHAARVREVLCDLPELPGALVDLGYEQDADWATKYQEAM
jgi:glycosyltransferase involved in cell wall biosynthesis